MLVHYASTLVHRPPRSPHVRVSRWDIDAAELAGSTHLTRIRSLRAESLRLTDEDLAELARSPHLGGLRWLSLADNPAITRAGVEAICRATAEGRLDLTWLDLRATGCDATPYLERIDWESALWWRPRVNQDLAEEHGLQRWMSMGRDPAAASVEVIPLAEFPPARD